MKNMTTENSLRPLQCEIGLLTQPDGSASFLQGDTTVMTAVYGPTQVRANKEQIDQATIDVLFKAKSGLPTCSDKYFQSIVRKCCESAIVSTLHPRTAINVIIQEIQPSGGLLATSVNSSFLALLDAGVPLRFTVAAVECVINEDDQVQLDPTTKQEETAKAAFMFAFESVDKHVVASRTVGTYTQQQYMHCLGICQEASQFVFDFYRESLEKKTRRSVDL